MQTNEEIITLVDSIESLHPEYFAEDKVWIYDRNIPPLTIQLITQRAKHYIALDSGEELKSLVSVGQISEQILELRKSRPLTIISVGGGACGDAIGFIASTLWRGVELIHIPTTMLAMIDSSIGGKTALNLGKMKNQIGSFYRASEIIIDQTIVGSLPDALKREGRAEMIKSAWLDSRELVNEIAKLDHRSDAQTWSSAIQSVGEFKKRIVSRDPFDNQDIRIELNFGHTVAHGIERLLHISHGEAVAWGLLAASIIGIEFGMSTENSNTLFEQARLIVRPHRGIPELDQDAFEKVLLRDKKRKDGRLRSILVLTPGSFEIRDDISEGQWFDALQKAYSRLNQDRKMHLQRARALVVQPPLSKSEQIRALTFPSSNTIVQIDNDDTFYADRIFKNETDPTYVGEGATGFRFAAIQAAFSGEKRTFQLADSLCSRKHDELWKLFEEQQIEYHYNNGVLKIVGKSVTKLKASLGTQSTSHIASGLALLCAHNIEVEFDWDEIASFPYFQMTLDLLEQCGAHIEAADKSIRIAPLEKISAAQIDLDAGAYAFWMILKKLGIPVEILGRIDQNRQPDFRIDELLEEIDANDSLRIDLNASPDLGPVLGSYAALRKKELQVTGAGHLRNKESNRIEDFLSMLKAVGVKCESNPDGFIVHGNQSEVRSASVDCKGDHRMVMAAALLSTQVEITLNDPMCVSKSYWNFWQDLRRAGFVDV